MALRPILLALLLLIIVACQRETPASPVAEGALTPTPAPTASVAATAEVPPPAPTPALIQLRIWGPQRLAGTEAPPVAQLFEQQADQFENLFPDIQVQYEPKPEEGPASVLNYMRNASAVAPSNLPDLIVIPTDLLLESAFSQLLYPLDPVVDDAARSDLYPFAVRDGKVDGQWLALPLAVTVEHGIVRANGTGPPPARLDGLLEEGAPRWQFAGQGQEDGTIGDPLLLQWIAAGDGPPAPGALPEREAVLALFTTLQGAEDAGTISRQVLTLSPGTDFFMRLLNGQVELAEVDSRRYLTEAPDGVRYAPIPTINGQQRTVVNGYLLAMTTNDARRQEAVASYLSWLLRPQAGAGWYRESGWLPPTRTMLSEVVSDPDYALFLDTLVENGWLRPGGAEWASFAQALQEQFRALLTEQTTPAQAANTIFENYGP